MSQRKMRIMRLVAKRFRLNLNAIKRDYKSLSHEGKAQLSKELAITLKEEYGRSPT
jgi:DNA-binding transcriptional regulator YhcF (GntR family)